MRLSTATPSTPGFSKTSALTAAVAFSATCRPAGVIAARVVRPSVGCGTRRDEALLLQPVDGVGDAGRVHLEPGAHLAQGQGAGPAEQQQHQHLVAGEGQPERPHHGVDAGEVDLLGPEDRRDRRHAGRGLGPAVRLPLPARFGDRVEAEGAGGGHADGG